MAPIQKALNKFLFINMSYSISMQPMHTIFVYNKNSGR